MAIAYRRRGVLPASFKFPENVDLGCLFLLTAADWRSDRSHHLRRRGWPARPGSRLTLPGGPETVAEARQISPLSERSGATPDAAATGRGREDQTHALDCLVRWGWSC